MQRYLWQQANRKRHAYDTSQYRPAANKPFTTLCGAVATPRADEIHTGELPMWFDPTCAGCNRIMLEHLMPRQPLDFAR